MIARWNRRNRNGFRARFPDGTVSVSMNRVTRAARVEPRPDRSNGGAVISRRGPPEPCRARRLFIRLLPARLHVVGPHGDPGAERTEEWRHGGTNDLRALHAGRRANCQVDSTTTEGVGLSTSGGFLIGVGLGALIGVVGWLIYRAGR
jgi:hypothetical protein